MVQYEAFIRQNETEAINSDNLLQQAMETTAQTILLFYPF